MTFMLNATNCTKRMYRRLLIFIEEIKTRHNESKEGNTRQHCKKKFKKRTWEKKTFFFAPQQIISLTRLFYILSNLFEDRLYFQCINRKTYTNTWTFVKLTNYRLFRFNKLTDTYITAVLLWFCYWFHGSMPFLCHLINSNQWFVKYTNRTITNIPDES